MKINCEITFCSINIFPSEIHTFFVIRKTKKKIFNFWWIFSFNLFSWNFSRNFGNIFRVIFVTKQDEKCNEKSMKISEKSEDGGEKGEVWKTAKLTLSRKLPVWLEGWPKINCLDYQKNCCFNICWFCWISYLDLEKLSLW